MKAKTKRHYQKHLTPEQTEILHSLNQFRTTVENGTIDVWWLYDDGGLALLLPYLLTQNRSYLEGARLRIFTVSNHPSSSENEEKELAALLSKFRIQFDEITVVKNDDKDPKPETISEFEKLIQPFYIGSENDEFQEGLILEAELENNKDKTKRILKMSEFLRTYSSESNLVVM
uniref:SLC12A transporter C-terminal domain-containing protein n=1 Tax=Panagrolaimus superbus TaxID=310955 RepID=A0A914YX91_9BILA